MTCIQSHHTHLTRVVGCLTEVLGDAVLTGGPKVASGTGTGGGVALTVLLTHTSIVTPKLRP